MIKILMKTILAILVLVIAVPTRAHAYQPDAPFLMYQNINKEKWTDEDFQIAKKLSALRNKFKKRPNIIYILADDVGWG